MTALEWGVGAGAVAGGAAPLFFKKARVWDRQIKSRYLFCFLLAIAGFVACLPQTAPFQPGQKLGFGWLLGMTLLSVSQIVGLLGRELLAGFLGLVPFGLVLWLFAGDPVPALCGLAVASLLVGTVLRSETGLSPFPFFILSISTILARRHSTLAEDVSPHFFQAIPLVFSVIGVLCLGARKGWETYWKGEAKPLALLLLSLALFFVFLPVAKNWAGSFNLYLPALLAGVSGALVLGLEQSGLIAVVPIVWTSTFAAVFTGLSLTGPGPQWTRGFGVSLLALLISWFSETTKHRSTGLVQGSLLLAGVSAFYLFGQMHGRILADLMTHYTFVGFLMGASGHLLIQSWTRDDERLLRPLMGLVFAAALPLVGTGVWGIKAGTGVFAGAILSLLFSSDPKGGLFTLMTGISAIIFTDWVAPLSDLPRSIRLIILMGVLVGFLLMAGIVMIGERRRATKETMPQNSASGP
ncbi:MAG: hypothetical protein NZ959_00265 [Armatimonadetes bacterium]|nr:hypothetical protein [Armatimonadota bacterium]MDW8120747.1 hypothetical protein [Armatimonadota bacterium]